MRRAVALVLFFVISAFILPVTVYFIINMNNETDNGISNEKKNSVQSSSLSDIKVFFHEENIVKTMQLEDYLCGVVAAEMPAGFENEALKAQAVAARSYVVYKVKTPSADHPDVAVCTDYTHCKAYKSEEQAEITWGKDADIYSAKIKNAVNDTAGEVLTYDGEIALTVFHSQSGGGRTENSEDVWGGSVPYLVSVESHGEENAPNFYSSAKFSFGEFKEKILAFAPEANVNSYVDIGEPELSEGGSVKHLVIGGEVISGKDIRKLFGLRSSCFKISADENSVEFEVTGYGHGVGMSQYGANAMAKEGHNYIDILTHYYTGTKLEYV